MTQVINKKNKLRGFVLLVTFFVILLLLFIGVYFLTLMLTESRIAQSQASSIQAYYLAEAGINDALWKLKNDSTWTNNFESDPAWQATLSRSGELFIDGSYQVQIQNSDLANAGITSTSALMTQSGNNAQRVVKISAFKALNPSPIGDAAIFSDENMSFWGTQASIGGSAGGIDGSLFTNNNIQLDFFSDITVENKASAVEQIDVEPLSNLTANILESQNYPPAPAIIEMPMLDFDSADPNSYLNRADNIYTSNQFAELIRDNPNLVISGITYVTGDVFIKRGQNLTVNGVLAADGNIKIGISVFPPSGSAQLTVNNTSGDPSGIFTKQKLQTGIWATHININGLVYAYDRIQLTNVDQLFSVTGGIITHKFDASSLWVNVNFTHNDDIVREALGIPLFSPIINIDHWEEEY